jgi:hypothetical protein
MGWGAGFGGGGVGPAGRSGDAAAFLSSFFALESETSQFDQNPLQRLYGLAYCHPLIVITGRAGQQVLCRLQFRKS